MTLKVLGALAALLINSVALAEDSLLIKNLIGAKDVAVSIKKDLKDSDVRRRLLEFLIEDMTDGIRTIRSEIENNSLEGAIPALTPTMQRELEKILGTALLNLQANELLADTILFENSSKDLDGKIAIARNYLENIRNSYEYLKDETRTQFYRKYAYARFTLRALNQIRDLAPEAFESKPNVGARVRNAASTLARNANRLIDRLQVRSNYPRFEDIIKSEKEAALKTQAWNNLNTDLTNINLGEDIELEAHRAVVQIQFNMELLKNMWGKQL